MKRPTPAQLEKLVNDWNAAHPVGTPVMRYKIINPLEDGKETRTRSEAWIMGGHSAMVMVEGVSGGVVLESVTPLPMPNAVVRDGEPPASHSPAPHC